MRTTIRIASRLSATDGAESAKRHRFTCQVSSRFALLFSENDKNSKRDPRASTWQCDTIYAALIPERRENPSDATSALISPCQSAAARPSWTSGSKGERSRLVERRLSNNIFEGLRGRVSKKDKRWIPCADLTRPDVAEEWFLLDEEVWPKTNTSGLPPRGDVYLVNFITPRDHGEVQKTPRH